MQSNWWGRIILAGVWSGSMVFFSFCLSWFAGKGLVDEGWNRRERVVRAVIKRMFWRSFKTEFECEGEMRWPTPQTSPKAVSPLQLLWPGACEIFGNESAPGWSGLVDSCMGRDHLISHGGSTDTKQTHQFLPRAKILENGGPPKRPEIMKIGVWGWKSLPKIKGQTRLEESRPLFHLGSPAIAVGNTRDVVVETTFVLLGLLFAEISSLNEAHGYSDFRKMRQHSPAGLWGVFTSSFIPIKLEGFVRFSSFGDNVVNASLKSKIKSSIIQSYLEFGVWLWMLSTVHFI